MRDDLSLQRTRPSARLKSQVANEMNGKPKILIAEDETPVSMMMVYLLTRAGYEPEVATSGEEAMRKTQESDFDLIALDVDLPDISGFEICSRLKQSPIWRDTPVIFVSGRPHEHDRKRGLALGAADYIAKPFGADEFLSRIRSQVKTGGAVNLIEVTLDDSP